MYGSLYTKLLVTEGTYLRKIGEFFMENSKKLFLMRSSDLPFQSLMETRSAFWKNIAKNSQKVYKKAVWMDSCHRLLCFYPGAAPFANRKTIGVTPHRMEGCPADGFIISMYCAEKCFFSRIYRADGFELFRCGIVSASNVFVYTQLPLVRATPETPQRPLLDLLLKIVEQIVIEKFSDTDIQAVTQFLQRNDARILAFLI